MEPNKTIYDISLEDIQHAIVGSLGGRIPTPTAFLAAQSVMNLIDNKVAEHSHLHHHNLTQFQMDQYMKQMAIIVKKAVREEFDNAQTLHWMKQYMPDESIEDHKPETNQ